MGSHVSSRFHVHFCSFSYFHDRFSLPFYREFVYFILLFFIFLFFSFVFVFFFFRCMVGSYVCFHIRSVTFLPFYIFPLPLTFPFPLLFPLSLLFLLFFVDSRCISDSIPILTSASLPSSPLSKPILIRSVSSPPIPVFLPFLFLVQFLSYSHSVI